MNESRFKDEVRKKWLSDYWSENIEDRTEVGWPDTLFLNPATGVITLVEFKHVSVKQKSGKFFIPWRKSQPIFLISYFSSGGRCGGLLRVENEDFWIPVQNRAEWLRAIQGPLETSSPLLIPVNSSNIREYVG